MAIFLIASAFGTIPIIPELAKPAPRKSFSSRDAAKQLRDTLGSVSYRAMLYSGLLGSFAGGVTANVSTYMTGEWEPT